MTAPSLLDRHDAALIDLDGTLMLAGHPIDHAAQVVTAARQRGVQPIVVTNNASRAPADVAARLTGAGISVGPDEVISSPFAAARMLAAELESGDHVLVVGTDALAAAVTDAGLVPVRTADDHPVAVVQGYSPDIDWHDLAEACIAINAGARWIATNTDTTLPTDRGQLPGNGALVHALIVSTGQQPSIAGKPARPLLDAAAARIGAREPIVIGDRLDTDIAAAAAADMPSLMVLTGVSGADEVLELPSAQRPTYLSPDMRGLIDPERLVVVAGTDDVLRARVAALSLS